MEKQVNHSIAFLDVFISQLGSVLNFKSFTSLSYKISLIKRLIDRLFKVCNNWNSFQNDIESIKSNLIKNADLPSLQIDKVIKKYFNYKFSSNQKPDKRHIWRSLLYTTIYRQPVTSQKKDYRIFAKSFVKKMLTLS